MATIDCVLMQSAPLTGFGYPGPTVFPERATVTVQAARLRLPLPGGDPVLGVGLVETVLKDHAAEVRGASSLVDPIGIGFPHRVTLMLPGATFGGTLGGDRRRSAGVEMEREAPFEAVLAFVDRLEAAKVWRRLEVVRDALMVVAVVPGEHWEVEFFPDGHVEVERFRSNGEIAGSEVLQELFAD
jgi:hypothetical protein